MAHSVICRCLTARAFANSVPGNRRGSGQGGTITHRRQHGCGKLRNVRRFHGLGNLGPDGNPKPVMEGKCGPVQLRFADIDSVDIEVNTTEWRIFIRRSAISATLGEGINLEDLGSPDASLSKSAACAKNSTFGCSMKDRTAPSIHRWPRHHQMPATSRRELKDADRGRLRRRCGGLSRRGPDLHLASRPRTS